jgi:4-coumarate--CoA ligase
MPVQSRWPLSVPTTSVPTFMFNPNNSNVNSSTKILIDPKRPDSHYLTLDTYRKWSLRFAAGLQKAGVNTGDCVLLFSPNNIFYPVVVMGALMAGAIFCSANPAYTARELTHQLKDAGPKVVISTESSVERALEAANAAGIDPKRVFVFSEPLMDPEQPTTSSNATAKGQSWTQLLSSPQEARTFVWEDLDTESLASRTAMLIYSSGTTGLSKGVELSHKSIVANMLQLKTMHMSNKTITTRRALCTVPMYHALGLCYYSFTAPKWGLETYLMDKFSLVDMLAHIHKFRITELVLVPPMLVAMAKHPAARDGTYDVRSVRKVLAGAAPIGAEVTEQFEELWQGKLKVQQAWGMSESPAITLCWDELAVPQATSTSIGELLPGVEAKLVRDDGQEETRIGEAAEFWIRSPNMMKAYWKNPKATAETITSDGWLKTGDIAYRDQQNHWYMIDRKKVGKMTSCPSSILLTHLLGADQSQGRGCGSCRNRSPSARTRPDRGHCCNKHQDVSVSILGRPLKLT